MEGLKLKFVLDLFLQQPWSNNIKPAKFKIYVQMSLVSSNNYELSFLKRILAFNKHIS